MNIIKLVSKNLFRRKGRFIFTLLGISIGMAAFVALLSLGANMRGEVEKQAKALGANLVIVPENICVYNQMAILTGDTISESMQYDIFERISNIEGLTVIPHLTQKTPVQSRPAVVVGILPEETKDFRNWQIAQGVYFSSADENAIIIGSNIAERFDLNIGDELTVRQEQFSIIGVLSQTQSNDDDTLFMPLSVVQRIFDKEGYISYMSAIVDDIAKIENYTAAVLDIASVQVSTDEQLLGSVLTIVNSVNTTLQLVAGVSLIAAAFGIINTMMTAIYERRREIGILRAIGGKRNMIFRIFLLESGLYGLLGGVVGVVVGLAASVFAAPIITQGEAGELLKGATPQMEFNFPLIVTAIIFSFVISIISGLYPAWRASKLTPVEAIVYE